MERRRAQETAYSVSCFTEKLLLVDDPCRRVRCRSAAPDPGSLATTAGVSVDSLDKVLRCFNSLGFLGGPKPGRARTVEA